MDEGFPPLTHLDPPFKVTYGPDATALVGGLVPKKWPYEQFHPSLTAQQQRDFDKYVQSQTTHREQTLLSLGASYPSQLVYRSKHHKEFWEPLLVEHFTFVTFSL